MPADAGPKRHAVAVLAFVPVNLLILMEVADRLSLKGDLEIARDIQLAMLPGGIWPAPASTRAA